MIAWLRASWLSINASYWFYPALFAVGAVLLSVGSVYADRNGAAEWLQQFGWLQPSRPAGASITLSVIAAAMIGVAATVFSITIAAVAYASGNYGPRLLTNFMQDKGNQLSLATFIGTFVYALLVLRVVRAEDEVAADRGSAIATSLPGFTPQLSLLIAMTLALISVAVLVYFLHHIPASIRINTVLEGIGSRLVRDIKQRYPSDIGDREPREQTSGIPITAIGYGYITIIDFDGLNDLAESCSSTIALKVRTGNFVHPEIPLVELSGAEPDEELADRIRDCFSSGALRTPTQDLEFLLDELAEIAIRALSPGINDPFTAITAMNWIAAATAEFAGRDLDRGPEQDNYDWARVQPLADNFEHFLNRGFGTVRAAAATNALASKAFVENICAATSMCESTDRLACLRGEAEALLEQARRRLDGPALEELEDKLSILRDAMSETE